MKEYLKKPHAYFDFSKSESEDNITHLYVITDRSSQENWGTFIKDSRYHEKSTILNFDELLDKSIEIENLLELNSVLVIDDFSPYWYSKLYHVINKIIDVLVHHKKLLLFVIAQDIVSNKLSKLISKVNVLQLSSSNKSVYKTTKYLCTYHFGSEEKNKLKNAINISQELINVTNDSFFIIKLKKLPNDSNNNLFILINYCGFIESKNITTPCIAILDDVIPSTQLFSKSKDNDNNIRVIDIDTSNVYNCSTASFSNIIKNFKMTDYSGVENNKYVLLPYQLYAEILNNSWEEKETDANKIGNGNGNGNGIGIEDDDKLNKEKDFELLTSNLEKSIRSYMPPKRQASASRISNELLHCPYLRFIGTSGRTFTIKTIPTTVENNFNFAKLEKTKFIIGKTRIKTMEFIDVVTKRHPPFKKTNTSSSIKKNWLFVLLIDILEFNNMPSFLIINNVYKVR